MKRLFLFFIASVVLMGDVLSQDKAVMRRYEEQIASQMELVYTAATDSVRYQASEAVVKLFEEALSQENSFKWQWDLAPRVSVLTASDKRFRIITWPVVRDNGEWECFGFVQSLDPEEDEYNVYALHDKSDEILNKEEASLSDSNWLGAVYQDLIQTSFEGQTYYTLLGWCGVDNLIQRKVIEPICFKKNSSVPQFGQQLFRRQRNARRVVLQYAKSAMVTLRYDSQFTRTVTTKRVKKKGAKHSVTVRENHDSKGRMIIFDEVAPRLPGMEGLYHYYVPTGREMAYMFNKGKWELQENAQGRLSDEKLNKTFEPLPKNTPQYKTKE